MKYSLLAPVSSRPGSAPTMDKLRSVSSLLDASSSSILEGTAQGDGEARSAVLSPAQSESPPAPDSPWAGLQQPVKPHLQQQQQQQQHGLGHGGDPQPLPHQQPPLELLHHHHPHPSWSSASEALHGGPPLYGHQPQQLPLYRRSSSSGHLPSPRSWTTLQQAAAGYNHPAGPASAPMHQPIGYPGLALQQLQLLPPPLGNHNGGGGGGYLPPPHPLLRGPPGRPAELEERPALLHAAGKLQRSPSPLVLDGGKEAPASAGDAGAAAAPAAVAPFHWQLSSHPPSDKIVSLSPGATEILWALGLGNRVVAVSDACDYPPAAVARAKARHSFAAGEGGSTYGSLPPGSAPGSTTESPSYVVDGAGGSCVEQLRWEAALIDEQVLARARPGLIVCEEEPDPACSSGSSTASSSSSSSAARGWEAGGGGVVQAVLAALVSVGLQHSCRVVCVRRRTLSDVLDSMLQVRMRGGGQGGDVQTGGRGGGG